LKQKQILDSQAVSSLFSKCTASLSAQFVSQAPFGAATPSQVDQKNPFAQLGSIFSGSVAAAKPVQEAGIAVTAAADTVASNTSKQDPLSPLSPSLKVDSLLVQAVPMVLKVGFDDVLTNRTLSISVSGATGQHADFINGVYHCVVGKESAASKSLSADSVSESGTSIPGDPMFSVASLSKDWSKAGGSSASSQQTKKSAKKDATTQKVQNAAHLLEFSKTTGDSLLQYCRDTRRLVICRSIEPKKRLLYCNVPIKLPIHTSIPLLLAACANETWFLESCGSPQPNISFTLPSRCCNSYFHFSGSFHGGLPVYTSADREPLSLQYNSDSQLWEMLSFHSEKILAVSAAHSIGFPAPMCWLETCDSVDSAQTETGFEEHLSTPESISLCIQVSGAAFTHANGVYFSSSAPGAPFPSAHMLGGLCSIEYVEFEGQQQWVLLHKHFAALYCFNGPRSPLADSKSTGSWVPVHKSYFPAPVSKQLRLPRYSTSAEQSHLKQSSHGPVGRLSTIPISNVLTAAWTPASDWKYFFNIPRVLTVSHIANTVLADAPLYEGQYEFCDVLSFVLDINWSDEFMKPSQVSIFFRHRVCGNYLHTIFSSDMTLIYASIYTEETHAAKNAFQHALPSTIFCLSAEESFQLACGKPAVSFTLNVKPSSLQARPVSVLKVTADPRAVSAPKHHQLVSPNLIPTFSDPSFVSFIKSLLVDDGDNSRQFWEKKLVSLCGSTTFADTVFVSSLLEFSRSLTNEKSIHHTTAAVLHCEAFQAFIKYRLIAPMLPSIAAFLDFFLNRMERSELSSPSAFDDAWLQRQLTLTKFVSSDVAEFIQSLCSRPQFQCILVAAVLELYTAEKTVSSAVLPAVASVVAAVFSFSNTSRASNQMDCIKLLAFIFGLHQDCGNFKLSHATLLRSRFFSNGPNLCDVLSTISSLIVLISSETNHSKPSLLRSCFEYKLFQQLLLFDDCFKKLSQVSPTTIAVFKETVQKSFELSRLSLENICSAYGVIIHSLAKFHKSVLFGFKLPSGWETFENSNGRTYYFNTLSKVLLLHPPVPSLHLLRSRVSSAIAFLTIQLFESPDSHCTQSATADTVGACFRANEAFASVVSYSFSRLQAFHVLHHVPKSISHPSNRDLRLHLVDDGLSDDAAQLGYSIEFDSSLSSQNRLCSRCLMYCSSLSYRVEPGESLPARAPGCGAPSDADIQFLDEVFKLSQIPVIQPHPPAPKSGRDAYIFRDGVRYSGEFHQGKVHGEGIMIFNNGTLYRGQFDSGHIHGQGLMLLPDGSKYEGSFHRGKREGHGTSVGCSGNTYIGQFKNDKVHGDGYHEVVDDFRNQNAAWFAGDKFKGQYVNSQKCGVGTTTFFNKQSMSCCWTNGQSPEHSAFQRTLLRSSGQVFCLSCILKDAACSQALGDIGVTIAAVFANQRPLFQNCIKAVLQDNFCCDTFTACFGSPSVYVLSSDPRYLLSLCFQFFIPRLLF
jgi:hypothetical protein